MPADAPLLISVPEAARLLGISRNHAYELIAENRLPHVRLGRRILIPRDGLEQWISRQAGLPVTVTESHGQPSQRH